MLILDVVEQWHHYSIKEGDRESGLLVREWPMGYQLVGVVKAHQG